MIPMASGRVDGVNEGTRMGSDAGLYFIWPELYHTAGARRLTRRTTLPPTYF